MRDFGYRFQATLAELRELLRKYRDSAPGPDGIPYSAWAACPDSMLENLLWIYREIVAGRLVPGGDFNFSLLALLTPAAGGAQRG